MKRPTVLLVIVTAAAVVLHVVAPGDGVRVYLLVVVAVASFTVATRTSARLGRIERVNRKSWRRHRGSVAPFLLSAERQLEVAGVSRAQFEPLRRQLRSIAEQRLARHGCRLGSARARDLVDDDCLRLLENAAGDRFAPGPGMQQLTHLLEVLERI